MCSGPPREAGRGRRPGVGRPARVGCRGPAAGEGFVSAARLWEGASPGTRWRGKGGIAGSRHAERPRSACSAEGEGQGCWRPCAPVPRCPPAGDPGPLSPPPRSGAAASASLRRAPAAAAAENGCQSGASRHAATGGDARRSPPAAPLPFPRPGTVLPGAGTLAGTGRAKEGSGASGKEEGRLPAGGGGHGVWVAGGQCREGALSLSPPRMPLPS